MNSPALNSVMGYLNNAAAAYKRAKAELVKTGIAPAFFQSFEKALIETGEAAALLKEEAKKIP